MKVTKFKFVVLALLLLSGQILIGQNHKRSISMTPDNWENFEDKFEFIGDGGETIMQAINRGGRVYLKDEEFTKGTINFDVNLTEGGFIGIYFRENEIRSESEYFYIRAFWPVAENSRTTLQYCTVYDSVSLWDLTDEYQAPAILNKGWNKVKLIISDHQLLAFVNDMNQPALHVPVLEGSINNKLLSFTGNGSFKNLTIEEGKIGDLPDVAGYDPAKYDSHFLKEWEYSEPFKFPFGKEIVEDDIPDSSAVWKPIVAKHRGQIVLNEKFGAPKNRERRFIWLRKVIYSDMDQVRRMDFGFSDEVFILLNNDFLYVDKNLYGSISMKEPKGRCSLLNTSFDIPLQKGENTILVGIANNFFGWGMVARLDKLDGITY